MSTKPNRPLTPEQHAKLEDAVKRIKELRARREAEENQVIEEACAKQLTNGYRVTRYPTIH